MTEPDTTAELRARALDLTSDLREPLHAVTGFAELMGESGIEIDPDIATVFEAISSETGRMIDIVTQLTDLLTGTPPGAERRSEPPRSAGILVVDDSPVNQLLTRSQLENLGYRVEVVSSGYEALEFLEQARPDLILLDWHMPGMDGLETARRVRSLEAERGHPRTPTIALTARAMVGDREECLAAGMDDFLSKPASIDDLAHTISTWLDAEPAPPPTETAPPESSPTPDVPWLDESTLDELGAELGDESLVDGLLTTFLGEYGQRRAQLVDGLDADDRDALRQVAHTLKSTSALLGAQPLSELAADVEQTIADAPDPERLIHQLLDAADLTTKAMRAKVDEADTTASEVPS